MPLTAKATVSMIDLAKTVTLTVRFTDQRQHSFRVWLAGKLFQWGSVVAPFNVKFNLESNDSLLHSLITNKGDNTSWMN